MISSFYKGIHRWLEQTKMVQSYRKIQSTSGLAKFTVFTRKQTEPQQKFIVFLCPATNVPQGGVKVIYNQAATINKLNGLLNSSVLHPYNPEFSCTWFNHGATIKKNLEFDKARDFVIIPEFWAGLHAKLLHDIGVQYGIYVQGGYIIGQTNSVNRVELDAAYHNAALILAISDDTVECIKMAFPGCEDKIYRIHGSVNSNKFVAKTNKENIICYMPRRLKRHSQLVTFFLHQKIPSHWRIESIDGLDENGVAEILGKSKIFLSFSELEGFALPPIEAALSGCHVIGYTGEGAKEYWNPEIFTEIHCGDIKAFVKAVLTKIDELDNSQYIPQSAAIKNLAFKYSTQIELTDMRFISKKIVDILDLVN